MLFSLIRCLPLKRGAFLFHLRDCLFRYRCHVWEFSVLKPSIQPDDCTFYIHLLQASGQRSPEPVIFFAIFPELYCKSCLHPVSPCVTAQSCNHQAFLFSGTGPTDMCCWTLLTLHEPSDPPPIINHFFDIPHPQSFSAEIRNGVFLCQSWNQLKFAFCFPVL